MISSKCLKIFAIFPLFLCVINAQTLELGFYNSTCPKAEKIIQDFVKDHITDAPSLASPLLRMHFHDCFVRGCDASILINSTSTTKTEKLAFPNLSIRGFDFIDRIKAAVEAECPGIVSCADIIALTARDAVGVIGGPFWNVPTGRRDGLISNATEANTNIPSPAFNFSTLVTSFASKGLNVTDLVLLSGAHTIGVSHCPSFSKRLYNFTGNGSANDVDPTMDINYVNNLKKYKCTSPNDNTTIVEMDPGSFRTFDVGYYKNVLKRRGLFQSDASLLTNSVARNYIEYLVSSSVDVFLTEFGAAVEKMGRVGVKTGNTGEVRKNCAVVNN